MFDALRNLDLLPDTVKTTDPMGLGLEAEVLRIDHDQWVAWRKETGAGAAVSKAMQQDAIKAAMQRALKRYGSTSDGPVRRTAANGFRLPKELTKRQQSQRDESFEQEILTEAFLGVDFDPSTFIQAAEDDLPVLMLGLAKFGVVSWNVTSGGEPLACTPANILDLLGWHGVALVDGDGKLGSYAQTKYGADDPAEAFPDVPEGWTARAFGPARDESGRLVVIRESPWGGGPAGKLIALWLIGAAGQGALDAALEERRAEEDFLGTPDGGAATSAP